MGQAMTPFGKTKTGEDVHVLTLAQGDLRVELLTYGARLQDVRLAGVPHSLTLMSDTLSDYEGPMPYHGALVGPVANRIGAGRVTLDGMMYELERNQDGRMTLHSGSDGMHARVWQVIDHEPHAATLQLTLQDGDCGLPGQRVITARFKITAPATLTMDLTGTTDELTLMNIANHSMWNMDGSRTWEGHSLGIAAEHYLPTDADNLVTGEIAPVAGTGMDFRTARTPVPGDPMLDHNFCLSDRPTALRDVVTLTGKSGLRMTLATDRTGVQVFDNHVGLRPGAAPYEGFALEAQDWPDAPAHRDFPSFLLKPDGSYRQTTTWRFDRTE
ncbi:aldose 1-epimerase [Loktanella sp. DSM 29012]|uniref:aldose epimerase family protein n=1 Tax=Loktanella sp. DSM 29012 TaxID=1881056 RepID=UPI0008AA93FC|nr:aldose epimerase family protein [Loktanella sp. DSM 29012]SEQ01666.1 aldose 1-epimerase [Loktanella sp. DSM 29012]